MNGIATTPEPPYVAVIFTSVKSTDHEGYDEMADHMLTLAAQQPGYLGVESARGDSGLGITVSYWKDEASVAAWKQVGEHLAAQDIGRKRWYDTFTTRVCHVQRDSSGGKEKPRVGTALPRNPAEA